MITNYLKTALRNLRRQIGNTLINIAGLTLGITGSLILFLFIKDGSSFDNYHSKRDRIYRIVSKSKGNNGDSYTQGVPTVLPEAFKNDFAEAEEVAFTSYRRDNLIAIAQPNGQFKKYEEPKGVAFTQSSFFRIFDRPVLRGSEKSLDKPNEAMISKKWALKYFHKEDAIGQIIKYNDIEYKIAAVMEDYPSNTDLPFDLIFSYITIKKSMDEKGWTDNSDTDNCYFLLKENQQISKIESRLAAFIKKYHGDDDPNKNAFLVQPLQELHTDMRFGNYNKKMPKPATIAFSVVAIFLLISCCINFVNLTTAAAIKRTREVGIRKVLGSTRKQLIFQLLGEAFLVTIMAVLISLAGAEILLGFLNPFMDTSLALQLGSDGIVWLFLVGVILAVTVLSGLYPALVVSSYKPALALKNLIGSPSSGYSMRRGLVVLQFVISQFFIIATVVITLQFDFITKYDIGFAKEAIVTIPIPIGEKPMGVAGSSKMRSLKNEILRLPGVEQASLCLAPPSHKSITGTSFKVAGRGDEYNNQIKQVDGDYLSLYKITLLAGQPLADLDTMAGFVVNEKLVKMAGFKSNQEMIGQEIILWDQRLPVVGVVKDFNTQSLSDPIEPVILFSHLSGFHSLSIKLNPTDMQATLQGIQAKWETTYPEYIFSYEFLDEQIKNLYRGERKASIMLSIFASMTIFIGCLGLLGLVTFMANQKTKEIGVRKVLGASVESIVYLFSKEFVKLILMAFAIAAPAAGFVMSKILEQGAYRIKLGPMIFLVGLGVTFIIAFLTIGFKSLRAALVNPVDSLRSE
jgi:ABC-type antimicrobial peptide transport system permease subunit